MVFHICVVCEKGSDLYCECTGKGICNEHISSHIKSPGGHRIVNTLNQEYEILNSQKDQLIDRINFIKEECCRLESIISNETLDFIEKLQQKSSSLISNLKSYQLICDQILEDIVIVQSPPMEKLLSPLESILTFTKSSDFIDSLYPPVIKSNSPSAIFTITHSMFAHKLYNFSDKALGYSNNTLFTLPSAKKLPDTRIYPNCRALSLGNDRVLLTGGDSLDSNISRECFIVNLHEESITCIHSMIYRRRWHAMSWIDSCPCVLGGNDGNESLTKVEIYKGDKWVSLNELNVARSSFSAVCFRRTVWIVGGIFEDMANSFEVYDKGEWSLFQVKEALGSSIGLIYINVGILMLGGTKAKISHCQVSLLRPETKAVKKYFNFEYEAYYPLNSFYLKENKIIGMDHTCKLREYLIEAL